MPSFTIVLLASLAAAGLEVAARALPSKVQHQRSSYPFSQLVAFGDELSDNGNGSYAHGISGDPGDVYGFGTWTDGPIAASYLANLLGVPLTDYAFGAGPGGGTPGATINNNYSPAGAQWNGKPVPSVHQQIVNNYTSPTPPASIKNSLQFPWVGQNDLMQHTDWFWLEDPKNNEFAANISQRIVYNGEILIEAGAPYVFIPNIYPKHLSPVTTAYLCSDGSCIDTFGRIIQTANEAIKTKISRSQHSSKLIYYDIFGFMVDLMHNKDQYGLTAPLTAYCDGDPNSPDDM